MSLIKLPLTKFSVVPTSVRFISHQTPFILPRNIVFGIRCFATEKKPVWSSRFRPGREVKVKEKRVPTKTVSSDAPVLIKDEPLVQEPIVEIVEPAEVIVNEQIAEERVQTTFKYVGGGVGITAAAAVLFWQSGLAAAMASLGPAVFFGGTLVASIGSLIATLMIDGKKRPMLKRAMWATFATTMAVDISILGGMAGTSVVAEAALATGGLFGALAYVGATMKPGATASWQKPLTIGLFSLIGVGIANMIWPAPILYHIGVYGGVALFGAFTVRDTNDLLLRAKTEPYWDPINESLSLYLDIINIFIRILEILSRRD